MKQPILSLPVIIRHGGKNDKSLKIMRAFFKKKNYHMPGSANHFLCIISLSTHGKMK